MNAPHTAPKPRVPHVTQFSHWEMRKFTQEQLDKLTPQQRATLTVEEFITYCRDVLKSIGDVPWGNALAWEWPNRPVGIYSVKRYLWTGWDTSDEDDASGSAKLRLMEQPFLDFARSYVRYNFQGKDTYKDFNHVQHALRALEFALRETHHGRADITWCKESTFIRAATLVRKRYASHGTKISFLNRIAKFINEEGMVRKHFFFFQSTVCQPPDNQDPARQEKLLPTPKALFAMAEVFYLAKEMVIESHQPWGASEKKFKHPVDVLVTSVLAILAAACGRINEVLRLPYDCEIPDSRMDGSNIYTLRWTVSKQRKRLKKALVPALVNVVKTAVANIKALTHEGRAIAKWYEENPGKIRLPAELEYLRHKEWITKQELQKLVGVSWTGNWATINGIETKRVNHKGKDQGGTRSFYLFADVERRVLKMLPPGFYPDDTKKPIGVMDARARNLKYSEALLVVPANFFHDLRRTSVCMFEPVSFSSIDGQLADIDGDRSTIFSRFDRKEEDGTPCRLKTHMLRRWLTSLVIRGGLSDALVAKWAGRDASQNLAYNYPDPERELHQMHQAQIDNMSPTITKEIKLVTNILSPEEYVRLRTPYMHDTEYGRCTMDWMLNPCRDPLECLNCSAHIFKKESEKTAGIRKELRQVEEDLAQAEADRKEAAEAGEEMRVEGTDPWLDYHRLHAAKLRELLSIFEDPSVPEGKWFPANPTNEASRRARIFEERAKLEDHEAKLFFALTTSDNPRKLLGWSDS